MDSRHQKQKITAMDGKLGPTTNSIISDTNIDIDEIVLDVTQYINLISSTRIIVLFKNVLVEQVFIHFSKIYTDFS